MSRLKKYRVQVNLKKCKFFVKTVEYLGHKIDKEGIHPTNEKSVAIQEAPEPKNLTQLRSFLGMLNFYSKFVPMLSSKLRPLYNLLEKGVKFSWDEECQQAFALSKDLLLKNSLLVLFDPAKPIIISCDASEYGVGAVLSHRVDGREKPVMFASTTLSEAERNYAQVEREALAIIFAVKRFHKFIYGRSFSLISDHQLLKFF